MKRTEKIAIGTEYLNSLFIPLRIDYNDSYNSIFIVKKLIEILEKKSKNQTVTEDDYKELIKHGCPDLLTFDADKKFDDSINETCHMLSCMTCWKNYVDDFIDTADMHDGIYRNLEK